MGGRVLRYRVNGCDHDTATQRTLAQVDGAAPAQVCSILQFPETAIYPPRDHVVDFRRQLGAKYQSLGRSAQSAVDPDGAAIWISEYLAVPHERVRPRHLGAEDHDADRRQSRP